MGLFLGIDLGTTNTQASVMETDIFSDEPQWRVIKFKGRKEEVFPSAVFIPGINTTEDQWVTGESAYDKQREYPGQVIVEAKSLLSQERLERRKALVCFEDNSFLKIPAKKVSKVILEQAIQSMQKIDLDAVERCTITHPASFPEHAINQTREAALSIDVLRHLGQADNLFFLPEPLAAILGYLNRRKNVSRFKAGDEVLVIDVGAGTTDFTIVKVVKTGSGMPDLSTLEVGKHLLLAGNDFDRTIAGYIADKLIPVTFSLQEFSQRVSESIYNQVVHFFKLVARELKERYEMFEDEDCLNIIDDIGEFDQFKAILDKLFRRLDLQPNYEFELNKKEVRNRLWSLLDGKIGHSIKANVRELSSRYREFAGNKLSPDYILIAGGSSRFSLLREYICQLSEEQFDLSEDKVLFDKSPNHLISKGAAIYSQLDRIEREKLKWPINDNVYLLVNKHGEKMWKKVWDRRSQAGDSGNSFIIRAEKNDPVEFVTAVFGKGFYDPKQKLDRVRPICMKVIKLNQPITSSKSVQVNRRVLNNVFQFELIIPDFDQTENLVFEVH